MGVSPYPSSVSDYKHSLPYFEELTTHTLVKSNFVTEAGADPYLCREMTSEVLYTVPSDEKNPPIVGRFQTGNCTLHIQLRGSQAGYQHEVKKLDKYIPASVIRVVDSGRQIRDPNRPDDEYQRYARTAPTAGGDDARYVYTRLVDYISGNLPAPELAAPRPIAPPQGVAEQDDALLTPLASGPAGVPREVIEKDLCRLPGRIHPQIPYEEYAEKHADFILLQQNVSVSGALSTQVRSASMTHLLLGRGDSDIPMTAVITDKFGDDHPVLLRLASDNGQLPRFLHAYKEDEVRTILGIEPSQKAKRCIRETGSIGVDGALLNTAGVILHREYKQDLQSVVETTSDVFAHEKGIRGYRPLSAHVGLITYSSGGSTMKMGMTCESLDKMRVEDQVLTIPGMPNVTSGLNKQLIDHCVRSTPLATFLPGHIISSALSAYKSNVSAADLALLAPGFVEWVERDVSADGMYFQGFRVVAQTRINNPLFPILRHDRKFTQPREQLTSFLERTHLEFELREAIPHARYSAIRSAETKKFQIKDEKESQLLCTFPTSEALHQISLPEIQSAYIKDSILPQVVPCQETGDESDCEDDFEGLLVDDDNVSITGAEPVEADGDNELGQTRPDDPVLVIPSKSPPSPHQHLLMHVFLTIPDVIEIRVVDAQRSQDAVHD
jgi:hypothetical protein